MKIKQIINNISPNKVRQTILDITNFDVAEDTRVQKFSDIRSLYYLICVKYCLNYSYDQISNEVNRSHGTVTVMSRRISNYLQMNTNDSNNLKQLYTKIVTKLIEENPDSEEIKTVLKIDTYDEATLKRRLARKNNLSNKVKSLEERIEKLETVINNYVNLP